MNLGQEFGSTNSPTLVWLLEPIFVCAVDAGGWHSVFKKLVAALIPPIQQTGLIETGPESHDRTKPRLLVVGAFSKKAVQY